MGLTDTADVEGQKMGTTTPTPEEMDPVVKLETWKQRIAACKRYKEPYEKIWRNLAHEYAGRWDKGRVRYDKVNVNFLFSIIKTISASIVARHPKFILPVGNPDDPNSIVESQAFTELLNTTSRKQRLKQELRKCTLDGLVVGHSWMKTGWAPRVISDPDSGLEQDEGQPFSRRVSPFDIFVDPEAKREDDVRFIIQKFIRPLKAIQQSDMYDKAVTATLQPTVRFNTEDRYMTENGILTYTDTQTIEANMDEDRVVLYEIWDLENNKLCVVAEGCDQYLRDVPNPYTFNPFTMLYFNEEVDAFYPIPDCLPIERLNKELNLLRTRMVNATSRMLQKILLKTGMKVSQKENLVRGDTGAVVEMDDISEGAIRPLTLPPLPDDNYKLEAAIKSDINTISRVTDYMQGNAGAASTTATVATMVEQSGRVGLTDKIDAIEEFAEEVGRKLAKVWDQFGAVSQVVRIAGPDSIQVVHKFTPAGAVDHFDEISVEIGSMLPQDETTKRQEALQLLSVLGPIPGINVAALVEDVSVAFGKKDWRRYMSPQMAMMAQGPIPQPMVPTAGIPSRPNGVPAPSIAPPMAGMGMPQAPLPPGMPPQGPLPTQGSMMAALHGAQKGGVSF